MSSLIILHRQFVHSFLIKLLVCLATVTESRIPASLSNFESCIIFNKEVKLEIFVKEVRLGDS